MARLTRCPTCGAQCRVTRIACTGETRYVSVAERSLLRKIERLEGALLRVRKAVAEENRRAKKEGP